MTLLLWLAACRQSPALLPYSGWPLWVPLDLSDAEDLGHTPQETTVGPPGALRFEDVSQEVGLESVNGLGNAHGVGLALVDLDGDAWLDLVVANGLSNVTGEQGQSRLFFNQGDGTFADGTAAFGGALIGRDLYSVAAGDIDNDGDVDLYFGAQPTDILLRNEGDRTFTDVSAASGATGPPSDASLVEDGRSKVVNIGDIDNDGWQDLVSATSTRPNPGVAVLRNLGNGTFADVTAASGAAIAVDGHPCAVMFTDYDNDGWRDLWIWNDRGGHVLLHNTGDGVYENLGNRADRTSIRNPMGIDGADIDHDGDLDYYVSNIGPHPLLVNQGNGLFDDRTAGWNTVGDFGWGLAFEDFDLDTWPDLMVMQEDQQPILLYRNAQGGRFTLQEIPVSPVIDNRAAHNVPAAFGDVDHDGLVDAVWTRTDGSPVVLLRNVTEVAGRHWLEVQIDETPGTEERGGIGARVVVSTPGGLQFRDVTGGSSRASQNALSVRFGLDSWDGADFLLVVWPDGRQQAYTQVAADRVFVVAPTLLAR